MSGALATFAASAASYLDAQLVTTGGTGTAINQNRIRGYSQGSFGSINPGTSAIYGGANVTNMTWNENGGTPNSYYFLAITGATNTGWTTLTIGSFTFLRASATFGGGGWTWVTTDTAASQAFGANGSTHYCYFT